jgi:sulfur-oxidizing protein SoxB
VLLRSGEAIDPARAYMVAGWASVNEGVQGRPIWDVLVDYLKSQSTIKVDPRSVITLLDNP